MNATVGVSDPKRQACQGGMTITIPSRTSPSEECGIPCNSLPCIVLFRQSWWSVLTSLSTHHVLLLVVHCAASHRRRRSLRRCTRMSSAECRPDKLAKSPSPLHLAGQSAAVKAKSHGRLRRCTSEQASDQPKSPTHLEPRFPLLPSHSENRIVRSAAPATPPNQHRFPAPTSPAPSRKFSPSAKARLQQQEDLLPYSMNCRHEQQRLRVREHHRLGRV
jgi:hypothetical protein